VAIYRYTVSCICQCDGLCLHSLHGGIFGVLSDVFCLDRMYDLNETM